MAVLTECSIIVHNQRPVVIDDLPAPIQTLLRRHWRLLHVLEPLLRERILGVCNGLDRTIWSAFLVKLHWIPWLEKKEISEYGV